MDPAVLDAIGQAFVILMEPERMMYLMIGVVIGIMVGVVPGISGIAGMALLLPFTFAMDEFTALAFLIGFGSVTTTSDVLTSVLFGVPGHSSAQATVLEGYPMAKRGEAGRALSVSYMSAMMGGLVGAVLLGIAIPLLRPVMLYVGSPELLAAALFGISMVAALSGSAPLRGLAVAGFGILFAMVGADPQTGTLRWTLGTLFLWDGLPLLPVVLGLFALPELCDLAISRTSVSKVPIQNLSAGMLQGVKDVFKHWWLALRCSTLGVMIGTVPGFGSAVVGWIAYAHALRTEKGANKTFGKGDVRGLIASESSNNAKDGGQLLPTIAFGVPSGATMAILLGAFLIHGLVPGPEMLTRNLDVTYAMVWSVAIANIAGAAICYAFSGYFAKLTMLRYTLIIPSVLVVVYIGAYQDSRDWGDFYTLFAFGVLGWIMKQLRWPRPPLILGFVLGETIERYMFISIGRYGWSWLLHPLVAVLLTMAVFSFIRPFRAHVKAQGGLKKMVTGFTKPTIQVADAFPIFLLLMLIAMLLQTPGWAFGAKIVPMTVGGVTLVVLLASLINQIARKKPAKVRGIADELVEGVEEQLHMDIAVDHGDLSQHQVLRRAAVFAGWSIGFLVAIGVIGFVLSIPLFVIGFMRLENKESWPLSLTMGIGLALAVYGLFDQVLNVVWPPSLLGPLIGL
jgi:TctA family transporter